MLLTRMVKVDDGRVRALSREAFARVLEARGWEPQPVRSVARGDCATAWVQGDVAVRSNTPKADALRALADAHHNGSTFDAFTEVERAQALLEAVEAAEHGEWQAAPGGALAWGRAGDEAVWVHECGEVSGLRLWPIVGACEPDGHRAALEARAQLPRLVRIICVVGADQ